MTDFFLHSFVTAQEQIEDARFFVDLLKVKYDRTEARALVSAVLAIIRSIPDHLLEEYNNKLGVNIPLDKDLRIGKFETKANSLKNSGAQKFISFYKTELNNLKSNPLWNDVKEKRDIKIHRKDIPLKKHVHMTIAHPPIHLAVSMKAIPMDKDGNIKNSNNPPHSQIDPINKIDNSENLPAGGVKWFFDDDSSTDIVTKFTNLLKEMQDFVNKIESTFS